jgi:hypothetical protein
MPCCWKVHRRRLPHAGRRPKCCGPWGAVLVLAAVTAGIAHTEGLTLGGFVVAVAVVFLSLLYLGARRRYRFAARAWRSCAGSGYAGQYAQNRPVRSQVRDPPLCSVDDDRS